jgi:hypothetical protein
MGGNDSIKASMFVSQHLNATEFNGWVLPHDRNVNTFYIRDSHLFRKKSLFVTVMFIFDQQHIRTHSEIRSS